jgi:hypothetical protein
LCTAGDEQQSMRMYFTIIPLVTILGLCLRRRRERHRCKSNIFLIGVYSFVLTRVYILHRAQNLSRNTFWYLEGVYDINVKERRELV